jgi:signal transduction histidine kinase
MPLPRVLSAEDLLARRAEAQWVEVHGVVRAVRREPRRIVVGLSAGGRRFQAVVENPDESGFAWLYDFRVSLRGVATAAAHDPRLTLGAQILVPSTGYLRFLADPPLDGFKLPFSSVAALEAAPRERLPDNRVHVRGVVRRILDARRFGLGDGNREVEVQSQAPVPVAVGETVELIGFAGRETGALSFTEAIVQSTRRRPGPPAAPVAPTLTTAEEVRRLTRAEAARGVPVRLEGTVTFNDADMRLLFVQDATAGIYVEAWRHIHPVKPGDRVVVLGRTSPGAFVPIVDFPRVRVVGHGPLPRPRRIGPDQLVSGQFDGQWLEVEGVARAVGLRSGVASILIAAGGVRFPVEVPGVTDGHLGERVVNARVRVRGVCRSVLTLKGQLADVVLDSPSLDAITILTPPPSEPFALPVHPIKTLLQFVPGEAWERRVRVQGVVSYSHRGELYVRDETGGVRVLSETSPRPAVGERVDAIGFATRGEYSPVLQDAVARPLGRGVDPLPTVVLPEQALSGQFDSELVQIEARLLDSVRRPEERVLSLQAGPYLFTALLPASEPWPEGLRAGSRLALTGICAVTKSGQTVPQAFQLLLRRASDIAVREPAPWWTPRRAAAVVFVMLGLVGLTLAWVMTLRRRVSAQARIIWSRVKSETELQERQRMARELHDTLEQNLTGISLSLEAASLTLAGAPRVAEQHLVRALGQVDASIEEVHRAVWALREASLAGRSLADALDEIGQQLASCSARPIEVRTAVAGEARPFAVAVENSLLRIGQEALTNAVKHGRADHIRIDLRYEPQAFALCVSDDGCGFDAAAAAPDRFGLVGMRERAREIGARLEVRASLNRGTEVHVTLPRQSVHLRPAG